MPVSANCLFHFTDRKDKIINILQNDFQPKYSLENFNSLFGGGDDDGYFINIPMVCFCDIRLAQIQGHLRIYGGTGEGRGNYGIGMTKEWGMQNRVTPMLYTYPLSATWSALRNSLRAIRTVVNKMEEGNMHEQEIAFPILRDEPFSASWESLFGFVKPYKGTFIHRSETHQDYLFYDEREWRFVPNASDIGGGFLFSSHPPKSGLKMKELEELLGETYPLKFTPNDIRYIIVESEEEILPMIGNIMAIKEHRSHAEKTLLASRVISATQIKEDF